MQETGSDAAKGSAPLTPGIGQAWVGHQPLIIVYSSYVGSQS